LGATFVAVGLDTQLLAQHTSALAARFKNTKLAPLVKGQTY
jgi:4-hydroxy-2-oxoheptanedioate aldolase